MTETRDIDVKVAEVMEVSCGQPVPRYSTNIASAMAALMTFDYWTIHRLDTTFLVSTVHSGVSDPSLPLAICRCILAAKGKA